MKLRNDHRDAGEAFDAGFYQPVLGAVVQRNPGGVVDDELFGLTVEFFAPVRVLLQSGFVKQGVYFRVTVAQIVLLAF